ncbi:MAG: hypothetical protein NTV34_08165 [Proteobacteria bacterium]|nr:hypothetical protein [Pseudomonadota bacterium]
MTNKNKKFDCVEMKNEAQASLLREYEQRKSEFVDFGDFIKKKAQGSAWQREMHERFDKNKAKAIA